MRILTAVLLSALAAANIAGSGAQKPDWKEQQRREAAMDPAELARRPPRSPDPPPDVPPLPKATITEAFGIGEALYDLPRLPEAIVSLLAQMDIGILADTTPATARGGLRLDESEVQALIALGGDDLASSTDLADLPYTFADLHAAVAGFLPKLTVEQLAEAYSRAYTDSPDALVPGVMMGQPITPETRLTRVHIWLLLMDGFAGPDARTARWGTADRALPDLPSPNPQWTVAEWKELIARLPLMADRLLVVDSPLDAKQGAKGPGQPLSVTARANPKPPALVSRATGKTLLQPRAGTLAGMEVTWQVSEDSLLHEVGTVVSETGKPVGVGQNGVARFAYQPGADTTGGRGTQIQEWAWVEASVPARSLVASAYTIPGSTLDTEAPRSFGVGHDDEADPSALAQGTPSNFVLGVALARGNIRVWWWAPEVINIYISNYYVAEFNIPGLGGGWRTGYDSVDGLLSLRRDGTYRGEVEGTATGSLELRGGDTPCNASNHWYSWMDQKLEVVGRPVTGFGITHTLNDYHWLGSKGAYALSMSQDPPDGYLSLEFFPADRPRWHNDDPKYFDPCQTQIAADQTQLRRRNRTYLQWFAPFNDAQWTIPHAGYGIALRKTGASKYMDLTSAKIPTGTSTWLVQILRR